LKLDGGLVGGLARQQSLIATSSGEAEYYALASGLAEGLAVSALIGELGHAVDLIVRSDSSACRGMASRQGLSKRTKHVAVKMLWVQEIFAQKRAILAPVKTQENWADIGTKCLTAQRTRMLSQGIGITDDFEEVAHDDESVDVVCMIEEEACPPHEGTEQTPQSSSWWLKASLLVLAVLKCVDIGRWLFRRLARSTRTVATQSQTTYRRRDSGDRFVVLGEAAQGAWTQ
jgi:hypothetical protein